MTDMKPTDLQTLKEDDPLVALRRHRREISDRFETVEELTAYLKQFHSVEDALAQVQVKIAEEKKIGIPTGCK